MCPPIILKNGRHKVSFSYMACKKRYTHLTRGVVKKKAKERHSCRGESPQKRVGKQMGHSNEQSQGEVLNIVKTSVNTMTALSVCLCLLFPRKWERGRNKKQHENKKKCQGQGSDITREFQTSGSNLAQSENCLGIQPPSVASGKNYNCAFKQVGDSANKLRIH